MKTSPRKRITDVALEARFAGTAEFSRAFKNHFDRTASSWDRRSPLEKSKICKAPEMLSFHTVEELHRWKAAAKNVRVRVHRFSAFRYVYSRIYEPYGNTRLVDTYHALAAWLAERRTEIGDVVVIGMSLDDPAITPSENCRYDLGIAFPQQPGGMLGEIVRSRGRAAPLVSLPAGPNAMRQALASAISSPSRSSPSTASETLLMWIAPGSICTGSGFLRAPSSRRICRQWRCSCGFRRK